MFNTWKTMAISARISRWSEGLVALLGAVLMAALPAGAKPVSPASTTTLTVTAAGNPVTSVPLGTVVTLTAKVLAGSTPVAPGLVKFCDATATYCEDIHLLGAAQLTSAGTATLHLVPPTNSHSYKAVFVGTATYATSSSTVSSLLVTGSDRTTTAFQSSGTAGAYTLTGTLTAFGAPAPTGNILFENESNNNALAATVPLDPATLANGFASLATYSTGANPYSIAVGDFKGNGIPDFAVANESAGNISVLLGNGDGTFASAVNYTVGSSPYAVAVGDFNADGIPDLVVANYGDNTVTVLLGVGDGTFTAQPAIAAGSFPSAVAVGDFNRDGNLDIAVADYSGGPGSVSILLGNGNGTFQTATTYAVGNSPHGIAVADFNADGALDLVTANSGSSNVSVLLGNGDGTFQTQATYAVASGGGSAWGVAVADLNDDGSPDIAAASSGNVSVWLNKSTGLFDAAMGYTAGNTAYAIAVGDFNVDGKADLAVANANSQNLSILLGNGDGTFGSASNSAAGGTPQGVAVGDFNDDGRPDVAAAVAGSSNYAGVFLGEQTETATATSIGILGSGAQNVFANYPGDPNYTLSISSTISLTGTEITTSLSVVPTPNPASYGLPIGILATLTPQNATGIKSANFTAFLDGTTLLTVTSEGNNQFQITGPALSGLSLGAHSITVNFVGVSTYLPSTETVTLQINQATPTLNWTPPSAINYGTTLATVLTASALNGTTTVPGTYAYTATPSGGAPSTVTGPTVLPPGTYTIAVSFTPTNATDYQSVSSSSSLTVSAGQPKVTLVSSLNPVFAGNSITLTATITAPAVAPTGSIKFVDGQTTLATVPLAQGGASYTTSTLALGGHPITAVYTGDVNYTTVSSIPLTETVEDFTVSAAFPSGTLPPPSVVPGGSLGVNVQVAPTLSAAFPSTVSFTTSGMPTGATATFAPASLAAGSSNNAVALTLHMANQIVAKTTHNPLGKGLALAMVGGMFLLPFGQRMRRSGGRARRLAGLMLLVMVAACAALGLTACGGGGSSGYFGQAVKNYTVTITATSGALSHSTTVTFTLE